MQDLAGDLQSLVREVSTGPLRDFQIDAGKYLRDLRREFLRHHRRLTVQARAEDGAERDELVTMLRSAQSDLAAHWRGIVLGRSVTLAKLTWTPESMLENVDTMVDELPESVTAPYEDLSYESRESDSLWRRFRCQLLRSTRAWRKAFGQGLADTRRPISWASVASISLMTHLRDSKLWPLSSSRRTDTWRPAREASSTA